MLELSRDVFKVLTVEESTERNLDAVFTTFPQTDEGSIVLLDPTSGELRVSAMKSVHGSSIISNAYSRTVALAAINSNEAVRIIDADDDSRFNMAESIRILKTKSMLCAPLSNEAGESIGAIQIYTTSGERRFSNDDLEVLVIVASQVSLAIQNVRLHETVRQLNTDLSHAARLSTVGEMVSGITHELHQPLAVISNFANACKRRVQQESMESDRLIESLEAIGNESLRAGKIMHAIRDFIEKKEPRRDSEHLNEIVEEAMRLVSMGYIDSGVEFSQDLGSALPTVFVNRIQVTQVVINLIMNAVEAMSDEQDAPKIVTIKTRKQGKDFVELSVIDTGPGIPDTDSQTIFEQFFTTKPEGLGIGLSISKSIVEAHDGTISFSTSDDGTTFRCSFPAEKA